MKSRPPEESTPTGIAPDTAASARAFDWSLTPLGPMDAWSPAVRRAVEAALAGAPDEADPDRSGAPLLRQSETARLAVEAADVGVWELDVTAGRLLCSDRCYAIFGWRADTSIRLDSFLARLHPDDLPATREAIAQALDPAVRKNYAVEFRATGDDGVERWISSRGEALFTPQGAPQRMLGVIADITDRKRSELHLRLLVNELNHRVKNSLVTIQAIAAQSFDASRPLAEAQAAFNDRIIALAEAHDLLTRENWEGADLRDVAARLAALHGGAARFELTGPSIWLSPRTALSLSMALHELASNAVKYGALSTPEGRIGVDWTLAPAPKGQRLTLTWTETGGPPVTPPKRRGFGSRLIERGLAAELSGKAAIDFRPEGVVCRVQAQLDA